MDSLTTGELTKQEVQELRAVAARALSRQQVEELLAELAHNTQHAVMLTEMANAAETTTRHMHSLTCLYGYHILSCELLIKINLVITLIVAVLSVLTKTEEAAIIAFFFYIPVIVMAIVMTTVSKWLGSKAHVKPLQWFAIASAILSMVSLGLRIIALVQDRPHGIHPIDWAMVVLQANEIIIAFIILIGADQAGFSIGQASVLASKATSAGMIASTAHIQATAGRILPSRARRLFSDLSSFLWWFVCAPLQMTRSIRRNRPKTE